MTFRNNMTTHINLQKRNLQLGENYSIAQYNVVKLYENHDINQSLSKLAWFKTVFDTT